jgi:hypothetical protein
MRLPLDQRKLAEMVKEALRAKNPLMYRELAGKGQLERFAAERAQLMREAAAGLRFQATQKALNQARDEGKDPQQMAAAANTALHQVDEYILAKYLEFPISAPVLEI